MFIDEKRKKVNGKEYKYFWVCSSKRDPETHKPHKKYIRSFKTYQEAENYKLKSIMEKDDKDIRDFDFNNKIEVLKIKQNDVRETYSNALDEHAKLMKLLERSIEATERAEIWKKLSAAKKTINNWGEQLEILRIELQIEENNIINVKKVG